MTTSPIHGRITGPIVMIGFGSIGKGMLPLIERHFEFDRSRLVVIDPSDKDRRIARRAGRSASSMRRLTPDNYRDMLHAASDGRRRAGVLRQSLGRHLLARHHGALPRDSVRSTSTPWRSPGPGFYFDKSAGPEARTNYALREIILDANRRNPGRPDGGDPAAAPIREWCRGSSSKRCSTSPRIIGTRAEEPKTREEWAKLMQRRRREGHPHRRARHPARQTPEAHGRVRQHLVGRRLRVGRHAAGGARLGHA